MENQFKIALLIDSENVSHKYIRLILDEISEYGTVTYKRVYGDFMAPSALKWRESLRDYAMTPVFQINYTKGKNASDSAMVIDAMDILYSGNVNGFCLVTSDSDFTKLAIRLREAGMLVVGMGEKKTPGSLVAACETFKFLDLLYDESKLVKKTDEEQAQEQIEAQQAKEESEKVRDKALSRQQDSIPDGETIRYEIQEIIEARSDETGWINLASLGHFIQKRVPGFDPRNYGYKKLRELVESYDCFEMREVDNAQNSFLKFIYVKNK